MGRFHVCPEDYPYGSLTEALAAASPGDWIVVGPGIYEEELTIEEPMTIVGAGPERTIIKAVEEGQAVIAVESDTPIEVRLVGLGITGGLFGVEIVNKPHVELVNCGIVGNKFGLAAGGSARVELRDNVIVDNEIYGILALPPDVRVTGSGNEIHGNRLDLIGDVSTGIRKPPASQTRRTELSVPGDYGTIQEAIDAIAPGGTIYLAAGVYEEEELTIWKPLTLKGAGPGETILRIPEGSLLLVSVPAVEGVRLEGLDVGEDAWVGMGVFGQVKLVNCRVLGNFYGLIVAGSARVTLANCQVTGNSWGGSYIGGSAKATLTNCRITGNGWHGLMVGGSARVTLVGSLITENGDDGIFVTDGAHLEVHGSAIEDNGNWGIEAELARCGWSVDVFTGEVIIGDDVQIHGNGKGDVCLPDRCLPEGACGEPAP